MLLRIPDFYDSFRCTAGQCTDTCCIGWEIDIDEKSLKRYASIRDNFADTLRQNIECGHFKLLEGDRCPFLKQDGLCDMICHLGEDSLCDICREHPRFVEVYGDIMEKGLGLCCEEAARLLLHANGTADSPIAFIEREINDEPDEIPEDAIEARDTIFNERDNLFKILVDRKRTFNERLVQLLDYAVETSGIEDSALDDEPSDISNNIFQSWIEILGKGESFGPAWDEAYRQLSQSAAANKAREATPDRGQAKNSLFSENDGEKIIAYLLFRYYAKSLFDGNSLAKVEFAIYFWIILQKFGYILASATNNTPNAKIAAIKLLSKQTEYSEEIMGILEEEFMDNPLFSRKNFKRVLLE